jgi:hypothetical protein
MFIELFAAAKIGPTRVTAHTSGAATLVQLLTVNWQPTLFVMRSTQDCYIRQGNATVTATSASLLLTAGTYMPITVECLNDSYLSVLSASTSGTLYSTLMSATEYPD